MGIWSNFSGGFASTRSSSRAGTMDSLPVGSKTETPAAQKPIRSVSTSWSHTIIFAADLVPEPTPYFRVPAGCVVRVRAYNGTPAGNAATAFVSTSRQSLAAQGNRTAMAPLDDITFQVDNTGKLWTMGSHNDGVIISVVSQAQQ